MTNTISSAEGIQLKRQQKKNTIKARNPHIDLEKLEEQSKGRKGKKRLHHHPTVQQLIDIAETR